MGPTPSSFVSIYKYVLLMSNKTKGHFVRFFILKLYLLGKTWELYIFDNIE